MGEPGKSLPLIAGLLFLAAPAIWAMHFFVLYGAQTWICATSSRPDYVFAGVTFAATFAAIIGLIVFLRPQFTRTSRPNADQQTRVFLRVLYACLAGLAVLGIIWAAFPVSLLAACQ